MLGVTKNDLWRLAFACCEAPESEKRDFEGKLLQAIETFEKNGWSREIFKFVEKWAHRIGNEELLNEALDAFERLGCQGVGSSEVYYLMVLMHPKEDVEKRADSALKDWHKNPGIAEALLKLMKDEKTDESRLSVEAREGLASRLKRIESGMRSSSNRKDANRGPQTGFSRRTAPRTQDPQPRRRRKQTR